MQATGRDTERQDIIRDHIAMMLREVRNLPPAEFQALLESLRPTENTQVEPTRPQTPRTRNRNPCRQCQEQKLKCERDSPQDICRRCRQSGKQCTPKTGSPVSDGFVDSSIWSGPYMYGPPGTIPSHVMDNQAGMPQSNVFQGYYEGGDQNSA